MRGEMIEWLRSRLRFLSRMVKIRTKPIDPNEHLLIERTVGDSLTFLESITATSFDKRPEIIIEKKSFKHYGDIVGGFTDIGGSFSRDKPSHITLVLGEDLSRTIPHEVLHYAIHHMNWNPVKRSALEYFVDRKIPYNKIMQWNVAIFSALEECSCYLFDALYVEKVTGKRYINMCNEADANMDEFAERLYSSFRMSSIGITMMISSYTMYLQRKYKKNEFQTEYTIYTRLINAINILLMAHHNGDLKAALMDTLDMERNGLDYTIRKLATYVPENISKKSFPDFWSLN